MILPEIRLQIAPNPIFRQKAPSVKEIDLEIKYVVSSVHDIIYRNGAVEIGTDMVGFLKRVVAVDLQESSQKDLITMINPIINEKSQELQKF